MDISKFLSEQVPVKKTAATSSSTTTTNGGTQQTTKNGFTQAEIEKKAAETKGANQQVNPYGADDPSMNVPANQVAAPNQMPAQQFDTAGPELMVSDDPIENINKMYRLKKIFGKIQSLKSMINKFSDPRYDDIKHKIVEAHEMLTEIVIPNLPTYAEKIDKIMEHYEDFLLDATKKVESIYDSINRSKHDVSNNRDGDKKHP